jgi:hypothetical protein
MDLFRQTTNKHPNMPTRSNTTQHSSENQNASVLTCYLHSYCLGVTFCMGAILQVP